MGQATVCDKCNKMLKCAPSVKIWIDFHYNGTADFELCEECKKKLLAWLQEDMRVNSDYARDWRY
jgi:hypothetical protein